MTDFTVYVLVRNDLPSMNPGKAMAQVHHAGVQMMAKQGTNKLVQEYINCGISAGADYFNTTLVLSATRDEIDDIFYQVRNLNSETIIGNTVIDPSYPFVVDREIAQLLQENHNITRVKEMDNGQVLMTRTALTCAWFLGDRDNPEFRDLFAQFSLHP